MKPIEVDHMTIQEEVELSTVRAGSTAKTITIKPKRTLPISKPVYPWGDEQEPIDFERHIEEVKLLDIYYFDDFIEKPLYSLEVCSVWSIL